MPIFPFSWHFRTLDWQTCLLLDKKAYRPGRNLPPKLPLPLVQSGVQCDYLMKAILGAAWAAAVGAMILLLQNNHALSSKIKLTMRANQRTFEQTLFPY